MVIMDLRDHLYAKAPYLTGASKASDEAPNFADFTTLEPSAEQEWASGYARIQGTNDAQAHRPLVGTLEEGGVIDPDVLWSCTNCGACVEQCPVDIEHVDHIMDMRRYQTLIESSFPSEAGVMMRNLENRGNPWGVGGNVREEWMKDLDFEVRQVDGEIPDDVEYLFWVGCAGAIDDRAKKVTKAVAELLHIAGVEFAVLGSGETCSGDPARRMGNEFLFQQLAQENVETLNAVFENRPAGRRKIVATCARRRSRRPAARPARRGGPAHPGHPGRPQGDLPRPVLPGPAQQGLHTAAGDPRLRAGAVHPGDAPL
jgi:Fe-S oxidoreductase